MATFICMDGLGGLPSKTFALLKKEFEKQGHTVQLLDVSDSANWSHRDRINQVKIAISKCSDKKIFLVGQSAGGSAVQIAASETIKRLCGVIVSSPALPRGYFYLTPFLLKTMLTGKNSWKILFGKTISPTPEEYISLVLPLPKSENILNLVKSRQLISGKESRDLAFCAPKKTFLTCPLLVIFGSEDRWISPKALRKYAKLRESDNEKNSFFEVKGSGHLTLSSEKKGEVFEKIKTFIQKCL